ncbi:MAG: phage repressor protein [Helicobacteraceae bacterium]|nr:phage repressor protein [Helicobacteraceae bacterium]
MKTFIDIVEDIKDILSKENLSKKIFDKDIATVLEISQMNFATMKKRDKLPYLELLNFCALRSISINWLLFNQSPESLVESTNKLYMVRYFNDLNVSAGAGANNEDVEFEQISIEPNFVASLGGDRELKHIEAINVSGDSMEPTFSYGDIVFINRSKCDIGRGGVFTIRTEHGAFIKRVQKRVDGLLDVISDNDTYVTQTLNASEIEVIGRVVGRFGSVD